MEFGELSDNPFSMNPPQSRRTRSPFASAIKMLLLVAVCLGGTVVIGSYSKTWLADHLVSDFDSLDSATKQTRLTQVAGLGIPGIDPLVRALADDDVQVARTAYELLQEVQSRWKQMERPELERHQRALVQALHAVAVQLPDDRTGWGTVLLQQTVAVTVNRRDAVSRELYRSASNAIDLLSLTERAGPSVLSNEPVDPSEPRPLAIRSPPKPISDADHAAALDDWTDHQAADVQMQTPKHQPQARIVARSVSKMPEPSVYRSGNAVKLQPAGPAEPVVLKVFGESQETSYQATKPVESVAHVVDSPMEALDDESVMQWLGSPHTPMREKASAELLTRGFSETDIAIATQISAGDTVARLAMIDAISRSDQIDPRPWLFMLLSDQNRQVRLRAISVLATMQDAYVQQRLRMRLVDEPDTAVVAQIHRALERR